MDTWIPLISEVGFPIIVTLYLLYRIEAKLDQLNNSIVELPKKLWEIQYEQKKSG